MSYHGYNLFGATGSTVTHALGDHAVLRAAYNTTTQNFELYLSGIPGPPAAAFTALVLYSGTEAEGTPLATLDTEDATVSSAGSFTVDGTTYNDVAVYLWPLASDPLTGSTQFNFTLAAFADQVLGVDIQGTVWFPHLDLGNLGIEKSLVGFDLVCDAPEGVSVSVGYNQRDLSARTPLYEVDGDTLPAQMVPMPVTAPSFDLKLVFNPGQQWEFQAAALYVQDRRMTS